MAHAPGVISQLLPSEQHMLPVKLTAHSGITLELFRSARTDIERGHALTGTACGNSTGFFSQSQDQH